MVAEDYVEAEIALLPAVGAVDIFDPRVAAEGAAENAAVGGGPMVAERGGDGEDLVGDGAFGGPETDGRGAEDVCAEVAREFKLAARIVRVTEARGQGHAGMGDGGDIGIAEQ